MLIHDAGTYTWFRVCFIFYIMNHTDHFLESITWSFQLKTSTWWCVVLCIYKAWFVYEAVYLLIMSCWYWHVPVVSLCAVPIKAFINVHVWNVLEIDLWTSHKDQIRRPIPRNQVPRAKSQCQVLMPRSRGQFLRTRSKGPRPEGKVQGLSPGASSWVPRAKCCGPIPEDQVLRTKSRGHMGIE